MEDTIVGTTTSSSSISFSDEGVTYTMPCFLCGDDIELTKYEACAIALGKNISHRVCPQCQAAWRLWRNKMIGE